MGLSYISTLCFVDAILGTGLGLTSTGYTRYFEGRFVSLFPFL